MSDDKGSHEQADALRFQERHRWKDISKEKPPEDGEYWVAIPLLGGHYFYDKAGWCDNEARWLCSGEISHWAHMPPVEEK